MKKCFVIITIIMLLLFGTAVTVLWWLPVEQKNHLVNRFLEPYELTVEQVNYTPPYKLHIEGLSSKDNDLYLPSATVWVNPSLIHDNQIIIDSVLIEGVQINEKQRLRSLPIFNSALLEHIKFHQLALKNVDMNFDGWILRDASIQIASPRWLDDTQRLPYGDIQFKASQVYVEGEALDNTLLNVVHQPDKSTVYGASFEWNQAKFSGQAELIDGFWSLVNVTINQLDIQLDTEKVDTLYLDLVERFNINHINSLDIISSQISTEIGRVENLNLSIESFQLEQSLWQQSQGYLSFDADSLVIGDFTFIAPQSRVFFRPESIVIEEWDSDFWQGRLQLSGLWTPTDLKLKKLYMSGIKLLDDTTRLTQKIHSNLNKIRKFTIEDFAMSRSQVVQIENDPYWQASGLNAKGQQLELKREGEWGLWNGNLEASVNSASYDDIVATQGIIEAEANNDLWQLKRFFVPLEQGYIDAKGVRDLSKMNQPWQLDFTIDGLPIKAFNRFELLPFELSGLLDMQGDLKGLSRNIDILRYSMDGHIDVGLRDAALTHYIENGASTTSLVQPLSLSGLYTTFNRGIIKFSTKELIGTHLTGTFSGEYDWIEPNELPLWLELETQCENWRIDILTDKSEVQNRCVE
ncbi:AsmA family protein [Vibrio sp. FNV 38]|nr:AsmA family protein [Vibrio sp. FNV 38]